MSMTIAEAIKQLDGANAMLFNRNMVAFNKAIIMAIKALQEQEERENPKPLTIEELYLTHGEPIYIKGLGWRISHGVEVYLNKFYLYTGMDSRIEVDGKVEFYRHKPKEV